MALAVFICAFASLALLAAPAAAQTPALTVSLFAKSNTCNAGASPRSIATGSLVVAPGCTAYGASSSRALALIAGASPPQYTYSIFLTSSSCAGFPDIGFANVPADGTTCVVNTVGIAAIPAGSASVLIVVVPSTVFATVVYPFSPTCNDATVYEASTSPVGCDPGPGGTGGTESSSLVPAAASAPPSFDLRSFSTGTCSGAVDFAFYSVPADGSTCVTNAVGGAILPPGTASLRLFAIPSDSFIVSSFTTPDCSGTAVDEPASIGCEVDTAGNSAAEFAPVANTNKYKFSIYDAVECATTTPLVVFSPVAADGTCVKAAGFDLSVRLVVVTPTPSPLTPSPTPSGTQTDSNTPSTSPTSEPSFSRTASASASPTASTTPSGTPSRSSSLTGSSTAAPQPAQPPGPPPALFATVVHFGSLTCSDAVVRNVSIDPLGCTASTTDSQTSSSIVASTTDTAAFDVNAYFTSAQCQGAPDFSLQSMRADGSSCRALVFGDSAASVSLFTILSVSYDIISFQSADCTGPSAVQPARLGCVFDERSRVAYSVFPVPRSSPLNFTVTSAASCGALEPVLAFPGLPADGTRCVKAPNVDVSIRLAIGGTPPQQRGPAVSPVGVAFLVLGVGAVVGGGSYALWRFRGKKGAALTSVSVANPAAAAAAAIEVVAHQASPPIKRVGK